MPAQADYAPLILSILAGLSTGLGGLVVFFVDTVSHATLAFTVALAAGVMISVSVLELGSPLLASDVWWSPETQWLLVGVASYLALSGLLSQCPDMTTTAMAVDAPTEGAHDDAAEQGSLSPSPSSSKRETHINATAGGGAGTPLSRRRSEAPSAALNHRHTNSTSTSSVGVAGRGGDEEERRRQLRLGLLMFMVLTCHNLPEGVAVAVGAMASSRTGLVVALAVAMHNIPEGLAIAVPMYAATGDRCRAFALTLMSGLSEPIGAALGILIFKPFLTKGLVDRATCCVSGIMIAVSVVELIPEALKYRRFVHAGLGFTLGWIVITLTVQLV